MPRIPSPFPLAVTGRRRRGGFTLIELMVAISIILILVAVSIAGISQLSKHTKAQRTQTALETGRSLLAGYIASDGTQAALKQLYSTTDSDYTNPFLPNGPGQDLDPTTSALLATNGPNGQHVWSSIQTTDINLAREVEFTARVMQIFLRVPENRAIMDKLPSEAKFVLTDTNNVALTGVPPLLADGNGEPLLFVPPKGFAGVTVNGLGGGITATLQSDNRLHPTSGTDPFPNPVMAPFWASSGADRNYTTGEDNAYSFQQ